MVLQQVVEVDPELERRFNELVERWIRETAGDSTGRKVFVHPAYREILGLDRAVLPLIFRHLDQSDGYHWYGALKQLTGADPVPEDVRSRRRAREIWLAWARDHDWL